MADAVFDLADRKLAWLDQRQQLLAQNVANMDTPSYRARDLSAFQAQLSAVQAASVPRRTNPMHLAGSAEAGQTRSAKAGQVGVDGNSVQMEGELAKVADTDASQELVTDLYRKYLNLYRVALGR